MVIVYQNCERTNAIDGYLSPICFTRYASSRSFLDPPLSMMVARISLEPLRHAWVMSAPLPYVSFRKPRLSLRLRSRRKGSYFKRYRASGWERARFRFIYSFVPRSVPYDGGWKPTCLIKYLPRGKTLTGLVSWL